MTVNDKDKDAIQLVLGFTLLFLFVVAVIGWVFDPLISIASWVGIATITYFVRNGI